MRPGTRLSLVTLSVLVGLIAGAFALTWNGTLSLETGLVTVVLLSVVGGPLVLAVGAANWNDRSRGWDRLREALGGRWIEEPLRLSYMLADTVVEVETQGGVGQIFEVQRGGCSVRLHHTKKDLRPGENGTLQRHGKRAKRTYIRVRDTAPTDLEVHVRRYGFLGRRGARLDPRRVETGDLAFDARFKVRRAEPAVVQGILDQPVRERLLAIEGIRGIWIREGCLQLRHQNEGFWSSQRPPSPEQAEELVNLAVLLARRLAARRSSPPSSAQEPRQG